MSRGAGKVKRSASRRTSVLAALVVAGFVLLLAAAALFVRFSTGTPSPDTRIVRSPMPVDYSKPPTPRPTVLVGYTPPPPRPIRPTPTPVVAIAQPSGVEVRVLPPVRSRGMNGYLLSIQRGGETYWLRPNNSGRYACDRYGDPAPPFSCYGASSTLLDLDQDGEPEVISTSTTGGSGGIRSVHVNRWNGEGYDPVFVMAHPSLDLTIAVDPDTGRQALALRYMAGDRAAARVPWVDVYEWVGTGMQPVNERFPQIYRALIVEYSELRARWQAPMWYSLPQMQEMDRREAMARTLAR